MSVSVACGVAAVLVSLVSALGWLLGRPPDFLLHQPGHQPALHAAERVESLVRKIRAPMLAKGVTPEVRRGSGFRFVAESCEVDGAGGVECFLRAADGQSGEQESVFVAVVGG